jgi:hypothetical protein
MARTKTTKSMSDSHKAALERGRSESRVVRDYLEALGSKKRGPGRRRTEDGIKRRLGEINDELAGARSLDELLLRQERRDLEAELSSLSVDDLQELEAAFVSVAKSFAELRGIAYATWRDVGVPPAVLTKAGIARAD